MIHVLRIDTILHLYIRNDWTSVEALVVIEIVKYSCLNLTTRCPNQNIARADSTISTSRPFRAFSLHE